MDRISAKPKTAGDWVTEVLRADILAGRLPPGEAIRQDEIAGRLEVSRMPVREAIRRLAAEGWIEERPNRVAIVAPLDPDDARELFAIRGELECLAVRRSFPRLTPSDLHAIRAAHHALSRDAGDPAAHRDFHLALYAGAGARLRSLVRLHLDLAERYLRYEQAALMVSQEDAAEHAALLVAVEARDVAAALDLLRAHVADAGEEIAGAIEAREGAPA